MAKQQTIYHSVRERKPACVVRQSQAVCMKNMVV